MTSTAWAQLTFLLFHFACATMLVVDTAIAIHQMLGPRIEVVVIHFQGLHVLIADEGGEGGPRALRGKVAKHRQRACTPASSP